jgi:hypothetical protein
MLGKGNNYRYTSTSKFKAPNCDSYKIVGNPFASLVVDVLLNFPLSQLLLSLFVDLLRIRLFVPEQLIASPQRNINCIIHPLLGSLVFKPQSTMECF